MLPLSHCHWDSQGTAVRCVSGAPSVAGVWLARCCPAARVHGMGQDTDASSGPFPSLRLPQCPGGAQHTSPALRAASAATYMSQPPSFQNTLLAGGKAPFVSRGGAACSQSSSLAVPVASTSPAPRTRPGSCIAQSLLRPLLLQRVSCFIFFFEDGVSWFQRSQGAA
jgi:hypothetical protein